MRPSELVERKRAEVIVEVRGWPAVDKEAVSMESPEWEAQAGGGGREVEIGRMAAEEGEGGMKREER